MTAFEADKKVTRKPRRKPGETGDGGKSGAKQGSAGPKRGQNEARSTPKRKEAAAVYVDPATLTPWAKNPRRNLTAIPKVVESIRRFGFGAPIVARKADRSVIAGHTRLAAALELGLEEVPVRYLDLSEAEAHALALADNRLGEEAEWDDDLLAEVLRDLQAKGADRSGLGWSDEELDAFLAEPVTEPIPSGDGSAGQTFAEVFQVLVTCTGENQQAELLERLHGEGYNVRSLMA